MAKHWSLGRPQLQARVQPTGDDGSDDHKLTLTVTFDITPDSAGSEALAEARSRDLLRLAIPSWLTPDVTIPVVVVPNVLGYNERAADDALSDLISAPATAERGILAGVMPLENAETVRRSIRGL